MTIDEMNRKRRELGLTYESLSKQSGVPLGTVQKVFGGITKSPRYNTILALSRALDEASRSIYSYSYPSHASMYTSEPHSSYGRYNASSEAFSDDTLSPSCSEDYAALFTARSKAMSEYLSSNTHRYDRQGHYCADDYYALPSDYHVELIDGYFIDTETPDLVHQQISMQLALQLSGCIRKSGLPCLAFTAPTDVVLDDRYTIVHPDIFVVCDQTKTGVSLDSSFQNVEGAPDLVIEILSASTRSKDMNLKYQKYHSAGIAEYWIIDPERRKVIVHVFGKDQDVCIYGFDATVPVSISGGHCSVDFSDISEVLDRMQSMIS